MAEKALTAKDRSTRRYRLRNMIENKQTKRRYTDEGYITIRHDELPKLSDEDTRIATTPENIRFIIEFMQKEQVGRFHWFESMDFILQNAGKGVLRCIYVVDHAHAFLGLAIVEETIRMAGGKLELSPYAIVRPSESEEPVANNVDRKPKQRQVKDDVFGMEVA